MFILMLMGVLLAAQCAPKAASTTESVAQPTTGTTAQPVQMDKGVPPQSEAPKEGMIPKETPIGAAPGAHAPQSGSTTKSAPQETAPAGKKQ